MFALLPLGLLAGCITTTTGFGGGLFLVTVLSLLWDPLTALTLSSMALLIGNAQRLYLFRSDLDLRASVPVALAALPGALLGSLTAASAPIWLLQVSIFVVTLGALWRRVSKSRKATPRSWLVPGSAAIAFLSATTGGGGFLLGPLLLSSGLRNGSFLAAGAMAGVATHSSKILGYSSAGILHSSQLSSAVLLATMIVLGNLCGRRLRTALPAGVITASEWFMPALCALIALLSF